MMPIYILKSLELEFWNFRNLKLNSYKDKQVFEVDSW